MTTTKCPLAAAYAERLAAKRTALRTLPIGWRYGAERDEAALVRLRDHWESPHDCRAHHCDIGAANLRACPER